MKKYRFLSLLIICLVSCEQEKVEPSKPVEPYVEARIVDAATMEDECNKTLATLKAVIDAKSNNDIATLMESIQEEGRMIGYKIRTRNRGFLYVYTDIICPDYEYLPVGVEYKDDIPYWTVDGEIFSDAYDCVYSAEQSALNFQNRYGALRFKYDSGDMARLYCKDDIYLNLSILKTVNHSDGKLDFRLANGTQLSMDWLEDFDIYFTDARKLYVHPGNSVRVMFSTNGASQSPKIEASVDSPLWSMERTMLSAKSGYLILNSPQDAQQTTLTITLKDGDRQASRSALVRIGGIETDKDKYDISPEATVLDVSVSTNLYYEVQLDSQATDWISQVYSTTEGLLKFNVKENKTKSARTAVICLNDICGEVIKSFSIVQEGVKCYEFETNIAKFRLQPDNSEDYFTIRGKIARLGQDGSILLSEDGYTVQVDAPSNFEKFAPKLSEGVRIVVRGHKGSLEGQPVMTQSGIKIIIDHSHIAACGWMELPARDSDNGLDFFHHPMTVGGVETRNYSFCWDYCNLVARWVAYPLNTGLIGKGCRSNAWGLDPLLPRDSQPVLLNPFFSAKPNFDVDRGHQCPSADRLSYDANVESFYGTNMTPQLGVLNQSMWANFEGQVRTWSALCDTLYVVTGCTVDDALGYALDNDGKRVTIPGHYFKALLAFSAEAGFGHDGYKAAAFFIEHKQSEWGNVTPSMSISIEDLESLTGIDFFANLPSVVGSDVSEEIEKEKPTDSGFWF